MVGAPTKKALPEALMGCPWSAPLLESAMRLTVVGTDWRGMKGAASPRASPEAATREAKRMCILKLLLEGKLSNNRADALLPAFGNNRRGLRRRLFL